MTKRKLVRRTIVLLLSLVLIFFLTIIWQRHFNAVEGTEIQKVVTAYYEAVGNQDVTLVKQYTVIAGENGPLGSFGEGGIERILRDASYAPEGSYPPASVQLSGVGVKFRDYGRAYAFGWVLYRSGYIEQINVWLWYRDGQWRIYRLYEYGWQKIENN